MKNSILNLEGVIVLSRNEKKNVNGGLASSKDCVLTGNEKDLTSYDTSSGTYVVVSHVCEWKCKTKFLGITTGSETHYGGCGVWG